MLLNQQFRPEFLNILDEIVYSKPLSKTEIFKIVDLMIKNLESRLKAKQLSIDISKRAKEFIVDQGFDSIYGSRPLKR